MRIRYRLNEKKYIFVKCMVMLLVFFLFPVMTSVADTGKNATARIQVSCFARDIEGEFVFTVSPGNTEPQNVKYRTLTLRDGEAGDFIVGYTWPGIYHYTVRQIKGKNDEILYDDTVYAVDVYVTEDENGKMVADPVAYVKGSAEKNEKLAFVNKRSRKETDGTEKNSGDTDTEKTGGISARGAETGDETGILPWVILLCIAAVLFLVVLAENGRERMECVCDDK